MTEINMPENAQNQTMWAAIEITAASTQIIGAGDTPQSAQASAAPRFYSQVQIPVMEAADFEALERPPWLIVPCSQRVAREWLSHSDPETPRLVVRDNKVCHPTEAGVHQDQLGLF